MPVDSWGPHWQHVASRGSGRPDSLNRPRAALCRYLAPGARPRTLWEATLGVASFCRILKATLDSVSVPAPVKPPAEPCQQAVGLHRAGCLLGLVPHYSFYRIPNFWSLLTLDFLFLPAPSFFPPFFLYPPSAADHTYAAVSLSYLLLWMNVDRHRSHVSLEHAQIEKRARLVGSRNGTTLQFRFLCFLRL